jgi:Arylsulfotransferase (ASST)
MLRRALIGASTLVALTNIAAVADGAKRIVAEQAAYHGQRAPRCFPSRLNQSAVLPGTTLAVSPLPDSLDASPATQISLLGAPSSQLGHVTVSGSRTGSHSGRLLAYSQGDGASFVPSRPFRSGEIVTVRGRVGAAPFAFHFVVAEQDPIPHTPPGKQSEGTPSEVQSYHSRTDLKPPSVVVTTDSPEARPGYIFAAPYSGPGQDGPMIFDNTGQVVWSDPLPFGVEATNLQVEEYQNQPVLTWWQGYIPPQGFGEGEDVIANSSYQQIARIKAGNGYRADLHDFHLTANDTALMTVFDPIRCDLSSTGGPAGGAVTDGVFQEIDLKTRLVRREWHSLDHVAISESHSSSLHSTTEWPFDYFHINSVLLDSDGSTLISGRNTWGVYRLDSHTGQVLWDLGGKHGSFHMGPGAAFAYQHDARELPDGTLSIFDNGGVPKVHAQSRAVQIALNLQTKTATLVRQYEHSPALSSGSQANFQTLPNGGAFIGWEVPYFTEYSPTGQVLFDAHLHGSNESYRAYRFQWTGNPAEAPAIAVSSTSAVPVMVYASWNGATGVASWRVLAGPSPQQLVPVAAAARAGFETAIIAPAPAPYVAVQALDSAGNVIGTSHTIKG